MDERATDRPTNGDNDDAGPTDTLNADLQTTDTAAERPRVKRPFFKRPQAPLEW